ncbi:MAG: PepSY domain-containing protein [Sphingopyxis sp.]|nr:PepSY domain-containing protein [Sphingopyxis sp.]
MTTAMKATPEGRRKQVPLGFWLHSIFGLKLSLFLGFVCLTGTIATVSHEIEWLYKPQLRATAVTGHTDWARCGMRQPAPIPKPPSPALGVSTATTRAIL